MVTENGLNLHDNLRFLKYIVQIENKEFSEKIINFKEIGKSFSETILEDNHTQTQSKSGLFTLLQRLVEQVQNLLIAEDQSQPGFQQAFSRMFLFT